MNVNFSIGSVEAEPQTYSHLTYIIVYAHDKNQAIYFDMSLDEAKQRFEHKMNNRTDYEIEFEGWDATINQVYIESDELYIIGNIPELLRKMYSELVL